MADPSRRLPGNVAGPYYCDDSCIACEACVGEAPDHFRMQDDGEYAVVYRQPENAGERQVCENALGICPVEAIGNDG